MTCGIYKITNTNNNKCYIGQSKNIESRWAEHKKRFNNPNDTQYETPLYRAFRKHGLKDFTFEIIEECSISELNIKESFWIGYFRSMIDYDGYNLTLGGESSSGVSLNIIKVEEISKLLKTTNLTNLDIANKFSVSENTISGINTGYYWKRDIKYPIRDIQPKKNYCVDCGVEISLESERCVSCYSIARRTVERPSKENLLKEVAEQGFAATGRKYGVSDKAIAKWCKAYGLPNKIKDIKELYFNKV